MPGVKPPANLSAVVRFPPKRAATPKRRLPQGGDTPRRAEVAFPTLPKDALQRLLTAVDRPFIEPAARARLQRLLELFGEGHVVLLIRSVIESESNQKALIEPIISAVSMVMSVKPEWPNRGLAWLEAFDAIPLVPLLETIHALKCFTASEGKLFYFVSLRNQLGEIFEPPMPPKPKPGPKTGRKRGVRTVET